MAAKTDWTGSNGSGTIGDDLSKNNSSGFSALPGGARSFHGDFMDIGIRCRMWCATEVDESFAWVRDLHHGYKKIEILRDYKCCGYSVRLLRPLM
jgi:uncharacterized protein (TIGR02145 family)